MRIVFSFCIGCRSWSLSPLPQRRRCRPQCMRLRLLAAAQSHSFPPRWGRHLTVPSAKEYRSRQREADCTRLRWKARAFRAASCIASSVAGSPESGAPFCRSLSMPPFAFCFQGQSTTLYFLKDMKSKILPPKIEKNSKKLSRPEFGTALCTKSVLIQRKCSLLAAAALLRIGRGGVATERGIPPFSTHRPL